MKKLSIVIPTYNEAKTIPLVLNKIKEVDLLNKLQKETIIVDDGSTDHTEKVIYNYKEGNPGLHIKYYKFW